MNCTRTVVLCLLGVVLLGGCTRQKQPESKAPLPPMGDEALAAYRKKHPEALIGHVVAIRLADRLLAAGDLPVNEFKVGDAVYARPADHKIATGDVISTGKSWIHIQYNETPGKPAPRLGDLVVRFKS